MIEELLATDELAGMLAQKEQGLHQPILEVLFLIGADNDVPVRKHSPIADGKAATRVAGQFAATRNQWHSLPAGPCF
jgi:hypothetical protein